MWAAKWEETGVHRAWNYEFVDRGEAGSTTANIILKEVEWLPLVMIQTAEEGLDF